MGNTDDTTPRGYPLPHPDHLLSDDALRLRAVVEQVDREQTALEAELHKQRTRVFLKLDF